MHCSFKWTGLGSTKPEMRVRLTHGAPSFSIGDSSNGKTSGRYPERCRFESYVSSQYQHEPRMRSCQYRLRILEFLIHCQQKKMRLSCSGLSRLPVTQDFVGSNPISLANFVAQNTLYKGVLLHKVVSIWAVSRTGIRLACTE